nr:hypothetical protein [Tanacetum cinerariifolium]
MNPIVIQQAALDNALVPSEKRLRLKDAMLKIAFTKPQKGETYKVTLEALNLSPCYPTFVITAEVPEIYMHQFWNTIKKIRKTDGYNFKLDKKKCQANTERTFAAVINRCIFGKSTRLDRLRESHAQILWAMYNQKNVDYVSLLWEDFLIPDGMINDDIKLSKAYKSYLDYATGKVPLKKARKFKKHASPKLKTVPPAKIGRGKGIELLLDVALLEEAQLRKTLRKSKQKTQKLQVGISSKGDDFESEVPNEHADKTKDTREGTGLKPGVPDVSKEDSSDSDDDSWGDIKNEIDDVNDEDDDNDDNEDDDNSDDNDVGGNDDGGNEDNYKENPSFTLADYEEEEQDEESLFVQEEEDVHVTLTTVHDKTGGPLPSSSILSDFTSKLLNLDDLSPDINSLMNTSTIPPPPTPVYPYSYPTIIPQQQTPDFTTTTTIPAMTLPEIPNFTSLFQFDQKVSALETKVLEFNQTSQFAKVVSFISSIVDNYLASKLKEEVNVKAQVSKIMPQIEDYVTEYLGAEVLVRSTNQPQTSYAATASLSEFELKKILIDKMETNKLINRSDI